MLSMRYFRQIEAKIYFITLLWISNIKSNRKRRGENSRTVW